MQLEEPAESLGNIIVMLFKVFGYFILGCIALSSHCSFIFFGYSFNRVFPLKNFVLMMDGKVYLRGEH